MEFVTPSHNLDWISFILIGVTLNYGILHYLGLISFKQSLSAFLSTESPTEERSLFIKILLSLNSLLIFSLLLFFTAIQFEIISSADFLSYIRIVFIIMFLVGVQRLLLRMHSFITESIDFFHKYLETHAGIVNFSSMVTLPILWGSLYISELKSWLTLVGIALFGGLYLFALLKTISFSKRIKGSFKIHIILYLCGNEILPLLLLYKLLI